MKTTRLTRVAAKLNRCDFSNPIPITRFLPAIVWWAAALLCCGPLNAQLSAPLNAQQTGDAAKDAVEAKAKDAVKAKVKDTVRASLPHPASKFTIAANKAVAEEMIVLNKLPFNNDFENSWRGMQDGWEFFGTIPKDGKRPVWWNLEDYKFLFYEGAIPRDDPPPSSAPWTVNPSLWRQAQLNIIGGLFEVVPGEIYQLRGFDLSNMTLVKGEKGWIVIDPLISEETAKFALDFAFERRKGRLERRGGVTAVIFTHSHIDHYGGVLGVTSQDDVEQRKTEIIAPSGFLEHAVNENIIAGNVMTRRATYMYGNTIRKDPKQQVGAGLGKTTSTGKSAILTPTVNIGATDDVPNRKGPATILEQGQATIEDPEIVEVDGVKIEFWLTPDAEAPSEMMFYFPDHKTLCASEELTHTLHNLYSLRGTQVRDPLVWSGYLGDALNQYGLSVEVMFASHHWPTWGNANIVDLLGSQRDLYKYLHDQTLRLANQGNTMVEIAEKISNGIELPDNLIERYANRGYYGTINHNVKAIYQRYLGWFSGNPADLNSLPPVDAAEHYVEFMGGAEAVLEKAQESYDKGEYRWVGMVVNHVVFADPDNQDARNLLAKAYEQLGYQAESGPWRDFYLTGASELRLPRKVDTLRRFNGPWAPSTEDLSKLDDEEYFNFLAIHLDGPKANGKDYTFNLRLTFDDPEDGTAPEERNVVLRLENSVLRAEELEKFPARALPRIEMRESLLDKIMTGVDKEGNEIKETSVALFARALKQDPDTTSITGSAAEKAQWLDFLAMLERFEFWFNIIEPNQNEK